MFAHDFPFSWSFFTTNFFRLTYGLWFSRRVFYLIKERRFLSRLCSSMIVAYCVAYFYLLLRSRLSYQSRLIIPKPYSSHNWYKSMPFDTRIYYTLNELTKRKRWRWFDGIVFINKAVKATKCRSHFTQIVYRYTWIL